MARAGALGDLLLLRPTLWALRAARHDATLLAPAAPARSLCGEVAALLDWDQPDLVSLHAGSGPLPEPLHDFHAGLLFSRSQALAARLGTVIPRVVVRDPRPGAGHAAAWYAGALEEIGVTPQDGVPPLVVSPEQRRAAQELTAQLPGGFLALHPGSGSPSKNWPAERFAALAEILAPGTRFLVVHGPSDDAAVSRVLALAPRGLAVRDLPLSVLGAVLARAGLFVGNDSGVSHLAAASAAPALVLFGPTDPALWAPVGARVLRAPGNDLAGLSVAEVAAAAYVFGARTSSRLISR